MQSIEEKIYEVFWDKNIARMINRADLFSFLKQYVNPGLLTKSSKPELVHDLKEYMTTDNLEFIAERMESFGLPMVDTVSVLDTTSYAVKKLVDNDTLRIVGTFKGGNQRIPYKLCSVLDILDISHKMFVKNDMKSNVNKEKSNVKNDDCKIGGHVVPDDMAKNFGVPDDGTDIPVKKSLEEAASEADVKVDTEIIHVHRYFA